MPTDTKRDALKSVRQRRYLNKEFDALRQDLLSYARTYYADQLADFSESSLGGLLLDFPAYVGDVMSFYLDHQFSELDSDTAVETDNIQRSLRRAGVDVVGASPAVTMLTFFVEVPAATENGVVVPSTLALPVVQSGTVCRAENGVEFELLQDVDFTAKDSTGNVVAAYTVGKSNSAGTPLTFILKADGLAISGEDTVETYTFGGFVPFRRVTLANANVTNVVNVTDSLGNVYYQVGNLVEDTVFKAIPNSNVSKDGVEAALQLLPVPFRYTAQVSLADRATTLIFGGGSADTLTDDAVPDPSLFALPLYGKKTFPRPVLNPQRLLDTKTLGVSASDVVITIAYRFGGGLSHNVEANSVKSVSSLSMAFPKSPAPPVAAAVRASTSVINRKKAAGGLDAPTPDELKEFVPLARNSQSRLVTKPDLIARVHTMPANFGRVFRASSRPSPGNPLATQLAVVVKDADGSLDVAPDVLKDNLKVYLNSFRMISDAIDIIDASVVNFRITYEVTVDIAANKKSVLQQVNTKLRSFFSVDNFHLDQPIVISDLQNLLYNTNGVTSVNTVRLDNVSGFVDGRQYSDVFWDIQINTRRGVSLPPPGGVFNLKFPDEDIVGRAI